MFRGPLREILSVIDDPALVIDATNVITEINRPAQQAFGSLALPGRSIEDGFAAIGAADALRHACGLARRSELAQRTDVTIAVLERRFEVRALALGDEVMLLLHDVTARPLAHGDLDPAAAGILLKTIVDSATDLIFVKDVAGRFILVNRALDEVAPHLLGRTVHDEYDADFADGYDAADRLVLESGQPLTIEEAIPVNDERRMFQTIKVPWVVGGEMRGVIGISRDMTDRYLAEAKVRDNEERYRLAARATKEAIWDWDLVHDEVTWNEAIETLAGTTPACAADWWKSRINPTDRERVLDSLAQFLRGEIGTWQCEYGFRHADGIYHSVFDRGFLVRDDQGVPKRMIGAMSDLSERMKAQSRVMQLQSDLIHVSRMSAMGTIASALAHEINQPLASASNFVAGARQLLERGDDEALHDAREAIDLAAAEITRSGEIVRRIRRMVAHGEVQVQPVPLGELIDDALALALPNAALSHVSVTFGSRRGVARGDAVQLQQVLVNLIRNAVDAMEDVDERVLVIATEPDATSVRIDVSDSGCGIPTDRLQTVFTAFGSSKATGLGVGLTICRTIVEAHGGQIWVDRTGPSGTCISVKLPLFSEKDAG